MQQKKIKVTFSKWEKSKTSPLEDIRYFLKKIRESSKIPKHIIKIVK